MHVHTFHDLSGFQRVTSDASECETCRYDIVCCGNVIAVSPAESQCPGCRSTFVVTEQGGTFVPAADDSHDVRNAPTVNRPYQPRTVYLLGRMVLVGNYLSNGTVNITTVQGTKGVPPSWCQHIYRQR